MDAGLVEIALNHFQESFSLLLHGGEREGVGVFFCNFEGDILDHFGMADIVLLSWEVY